jgi:hypothetical protein
MTNRTKIMQELEKNTPAEPLRVQTAVFGSVSVGLAVALSFYIVLSIAVWLTGRPRDELLILEGVLWVAVFVSAVIFPFTLWTGAAEKRMLLYFGSLLKLQDGGGYRRLVRTTLEPERFVSEFTSLIRRHCRLKSPPEERSHDGGFFCRVLPAFAGVFEVEVTPVGANHWSISVQRCRPFSWPRWSLEEAVAAATLGSLLLLAERHRLIQADFQEGIPRERIVREFRKMPFMVEAALGEKFREVS